MRTVSAALRFGLVVSFSALALTACEDLNRGQGQTVLDAHVVRVIETGDRNPTPTGMRQPYQRLELQLDSGLYRGEVVTVEWGGRRALDPNGFLRAGDQVLVAETRDGGQRNYAIQEIVRLPALAPFAVVLFVALLAVARLKGLAALAGLAASIAVFLLAIVPALQRGGDPLVATLRLTGLGTEDQIFLAVGTDGRIDMPRLVLAGVIVGSLGALVDMCVGQASATMELASLEADLSPAQLYRSALNVGHDHIGSLVNTLALAYFGGALPLVLLLSLGFQPISVALNSEEIIGSIFTVLAASIGLVLCVPITTAIAVYFARRGVA